jgi:hypothetical protein
MLLRAIEKLSVVDVLGVLRLSAEDHGLDAGRKQAIAIAIRVAGPDSILSAEVRHGRPRAFWAA